MKKKESSRQNKEPISMIGLIRNFVLFWSFANILIVVFQLVNNQNLAEIPDDHSPGRSVVIPAFPNTRRKCKSEKVKSVVKSTLRSGHRSPEKITVQVADILFFQAYPERNERPIDPELDSQALQNEWWRYKTEAYDCYLDLQETTVAVDSQDEFIPKYAVITDHFLDSL